MTSLAHSIPLPLARTVLCGYLSLIGVGRADLIVVAPLAIEVGRVVTLKRSELRRGLGIRLIEEIAGLPQPSIRHPALIGGDLAPLCREWRG